jgi:hypothetical protein
VIRSISCALAALSACGCAGVESATARSQDDVYITGSHLPRRIPPTRGEVSSVSGSEAQELVRGRVGPPAPGSGR